MSTGPTVTAARIAAGDDRRHYDRVAIALHWATVALVIFQLASSQTWGYFPRPTRHLLIVGHMSSGMLLGLVVVTRIAWRLIPGHQVSAAMSGWVEIASKTVHYLLYALLGSEVVLGFGLRWSGAEAMDFFGLPFPSPFPPSTRPTHELIGQAHEWLGWTIVGLASGHATAALFHHYVLHDDVLWRMLPGRRSRVREQAAPSPERAARRR